jgi:hypothetical protein
MQSFKDSALQDSRFLIDLIDSVKPSAVDYQLVTAGQTGERTMSGWNLQF